MTQQQKSAVQAYIDMFDYRYLNSFNSAKTSFGFTRALFGGFSASNQLKDIFNFLAISRRIATAGQPSAGQLSSVRDAGFSHVINLAPHDDEIALPNEEQLVRDLGMTYTHIPVDFDHPRDEDFAAFTRAMGEPEHDKVFVHCAANMRVSAFLYRYRVRVMGVAPGKARKDLERIWKPFGVWEDFIND